MKYLPLTLGLLCIIGAGYQLYQGSYLFINGQSVEGRVIRNERSLGKSTVYYPIVEFHTLSGQTYTCKGHSGTSPAEYEINDTVRVHFDPTKPANAFIGSFFGLLQGFLFSITLGVLFSWFGLKVLGWAKPQATLAPFLPALLSLKKTHLPLMNKLSFSHGKVISSSFPKE